VILTKNHFAVMIAFNNSLWYGRSLLVCLRKYFANVVKKLPCFEVLQPVVSTCL